MALSTQFMSYRAFKVELYYSLEMERAYSGRSRQVRKKAS